MSCMQERVSMRSLFQCECSWTLRMLGVPMYHFGNPPKLHEIENKLDAPMILWLSYIPDRYRTPSCSFNQGRYSTKGNWWKAITCVMMTNRAETKQWQQPKLLALFKSIPLFLRLMMKWKLILIMILSDLQSKYQLWWSNCSKKWWFDPRKGY